MYRGPAASLCEFSTARESVLLTPALFNGQLYFSLSAFPYFRHFLLAFNSVPPNLFTDIFIFTLIFPVMLLQILVK